MSDIKSGAHGCGTSGSATPTGTAPTPPTPYLELHACMGLNACKGHDRFGTNACAGRGYCATTQHVCHTLNNCRGQGGCGLFGTADEQCIPGENACAYQGSCATPIQAERFSTLGANAGKSVWLLARALFEQRMERSRRTVGPSPFPCGPPQAWLDKTIDGYDSCGSSGDKYCSFGFNDPNDNAQALCRRSRRELPETLQGCGCGDEDG